MQWSHDGDFASVAYGEIAETGFLEHLSFVQWRSIHINIYGAFMYL